MKTILPDNKTIKYPEQSILTIYTGPDHFSVSVYDPEDKDSYLYRELIGENRSSVFSGYRAAFDDQDFFTLPFRKVQIMNRTAQFAFVPDTFYETKYKDDYTHFLFSERQGITLSDWVSSSTGITILYQLPENIYRCMLRSFSATEFFHYSSPIISYFLNWNNNIQSRQMVVNLKENGVDIFCFSNETFLLGNYFMCKDLTEALYFILYVWKQLQLNQLDDSLLFMGDNYYKEELYDRLTLHIQHIRFMNIPAEFHFESLRTDRIPFELAALSVCEL